MLTSLLNIGICTGPACNAEVGCSSSATPAAPEISAAPSTPNGSVLLSKTAGEGTISVYLGLAAEVNSDTGTLLSADASFPFAVEDLTNGTTYYFVAVATVEGIASEDSAVTSAAPFMIPQTASDVVAVAFPNLGAPYALFVMDVASNADLIDRVGGSVTLTRTGTTTAKNPSTDLVDTPSVLAASGDNGWIGPTDFFNIGDGERYAIMLLERLNTDTATRAHVRKRLTLIQDANPGFAISNGSSAGVRVPAFRHSDGAGAAVALTVENTQHNGLFNQVLAGRDDTTDRAFSQLGGNTRALGGTTDGSLANDEPFAIGGISGAGMEWYAVILWRGSEVGSGFGADDITQIRDHLGLS